MISTATDTLLNTIKSWMPPLLQPGQIGFCSPADAGDEYLLGLYIYSVLRDMRYQMTSPMRMDNNISQSAPFCVEFCFMATSYAGKKSGLPDDYKVMERVLQLWPDLSVLSLTTALQPSYIPAPRIELLTVDPDMASKIWQFPGVPYRLSLFYKCSPVAIPSQKQTVTARIGSVDYTTKEGGE